MKGGFSVKTIKILAIILFFGLSSAIYGQDSNDLKYKSEKKYSKDSSIEVIYKDSLANQPEHKEPVYFVNEIPLKNNSEIKFLDPSKIKSIVVEKENFQLDGKEYYGKVILNTKDGYHPNFISLEQLNSKYLNLDATPVIYQIDDELIASLPKEQLIEENFILKIEVSKIAVSALKNKINLVKIYTKTDENIEEANQIIIRGSEI